MPNRPRPTRESVTMSIDDIDEDVPQHVRDAYEELYHHMEGDWYRLLELKSRDTLPEFDEYAIMPSLIDFSVASRRETNEGAIAQLPPTIRDETGYCETVAWLYESDNEEPESREAKFKIKAVLYDFWYEIREQPQRHDQMTMPPFDMVWRLLERQQQMAEAGEGRMARIDRLLDLLLQEEFAGLFPMILTRWQWAQIFLADFELEDYKMLYILEMQYCFIDLPVYRAAAQ
ncbi:hypothetical protein E4U56_003960 [Claviceps arundinis]|uniref:Uncharacterized protein n=1 Tax=Claviceps arundinis TaxID=1623583 RepID=A0A9P7MPC1_9HYPO|nr:hypothetical protein E4U56_003960 [Claviceps arundinis]